MAEGSVAQLERLAARGHWGIKKGLDNPRALLAALGHPEASFPALLIGGTNGKGSTGAFLAQALRAGGYRIGWTTSPHLLGPWERIALDGAFLEPEALDRLLGQVFAAERAAGLQATYFELVIAAAMLAFCEAKVDLALVEVGMGGRWDATNTLDPLLSVLTNVALDHTQYLGDTRAAIAREKLCIARPGRPLVLGPGLDPAWLAPLLETTPRLCPAPRLTAERIAWGHSLVQGHAVGLAGAHQLENLATAREVLRQLEVLGFPVPEASAWEGIGRTRWPGRLWEAPGLAEVWMDGAHNPAGARVLADHALATGLRPHLVFGAMGDKDLAGIAAELARMAPRSVTLVCGEDARYARAEALRTAWGNTVLPVLTVEAAARSLHDAADAPRLVTGSLFMIGDLLRALDLTPRL